MTEITLKSDTSIAEGFYRVFKRAIDNGESIRLFAVGDDEPFTFGNVTEAVFYADGFLTVTPESSTVSLYRNIQRMSSRAQD